MFSELAAGNLGRISRNPYPGRGIIIGMTRDRTRMMLVYWLMGRSENSRNRIFVEEPDGIRTQAFDPSKLTDPSLIIYWPTRQVGTLHLVTNGDQTDTLACLMQEGSSFDDALMTRRFEPDSPNWTPRISGMADVADPLGSYRLSILKTQDGNPEGCVSCFTGTTRPSGDSAIASTPIRATGTRCRLFWEILIWYRFPTQLMMGKTPPLYLLGARVG